MDVNETVDWTQQTRDKNQWLAVLDTTFNLAVSVKVQDSHLFKKKKKKTLFLEANFLCVILYLCYTEICSSHFGLLL